MKYAITEYRGSIVATGDASTNAPEHLKHRRYYHNLALERAKADGDLQQVAFWQTSCDVLQEKLNKHQQGYLL